MSHYQTRSANNKNILLNYSTDFFWFHRDLAVLVWWSYLFDDGVIRNYRLNVIEKKFNPPLFFETQIMIMEKVVSSNTGRLNVQSNLS